MLKKERTDKKKCIFFYLIVEDEKKKMKEGIFSNQDIKNIRNREEKKTIRNGRGVAIGVEIDILEEKCKTVERSSDMFQTHLFKLFFDTGSLLSRELG